MIQILHDHRITLIHQHRATPSSRPVRPLLVAHECPIQQSDRLGQIRFAPRIIQIIFFGKNTNPKLPRIRMRFQNDFDRLFVFLQLFKLDERVDFLGQLQPFGIVKTVQPVRCHSREPPVNRLVRRGWNRLQFGWMLDVLVGNSTNLQVFHVVLLVTEIFVESFAKWRTTRPEK